MNLVTVFACVSAIAKTVGRLPLYVYGRDKKPLSGHSLERVLKYPNAEMTGVDFRAAMTANATLHGSAIARVVRNNAGDVAELWPIPSSHVSYRRDLPTGRIKYRLWNAATGATEEVDFSRILHMRGLTFDGINAMSPEQGLHNTIQIARAIDTFRASYYANGGNSSMLIKTKHELTEAQQTSLKRQISELRSEPGQTRPIVLGQDMDAITLDKSSRDSETALTRKEQDLAICRMFGVPPHMVGLGDSVSAANTEQRAKEWIQTSLGFDLASQEAVFGALLTRPEQTSGIHLKYDLDELASGDMAARFAAYAVARQNGWMSVNEIRAEEEWPPIPNGNVYLEPLNMQQAGSGATGNPGSQTTRQNYTPMQTPRFDQLAYLNYGYQAHAGVEMLAKQCMDKRLAVGQSISRAAEMWSRCAKIQIKNEAPANELRLFGTIGESYYYDAPGITAVSVQKWLDTQTGDIVVYLNSPGGDVFEGNQIRNALKDYAAKGRAVNVRVGAIAASIASVIMTAGTSVEMASNGLIMIHQAWTCTAGNAIDLFKEATVLQKIDETFLQAYHERTGTSKAELALLLAAETWMNAEEALAANFIDSICGALDFAPEPPAPPAQKAMAEEKAMLQTALDRITKKTAAWKLAA